MEYEIIYSLRGDKYIGRFLKGFSTERKALNFARKIENLPAGTIHFAITCVDGRTIWNTETQGLLG